jgi:hypothetical protein
MNSMFAANDGDYMLKPISVAPFSRQRDCEGVQRLIPVETPSSCHMEVERRRSGLQKEPASSQCGLKATVRV